ncbi:hypothetical protein C8F01DRAFT_1110905 [Mycena amicta]|nr:hypothetical protein C8F01DRAFT_1110905 [Mycena amicta]
MGKTNTKRKRDESESEEDEEEEEGFAVEVITMARVSDASVAEDGWQYRVKWDGYDSSEDSWEPAPHLSACQGLLKRFWNHVGVDDNDYEEGHIVRASAEWIAKERKRYRVEFNKERDEKRKQQERAERRREQKIAAASKKATREKKEKQSLSSKQTLPSLPARSASTASLSKPPPKKKAKVVVTSDDDSDEEESLASVRKKKAKDLPPKGKQRAPIASTSKTATPTRPSSPALAAVRSLFTPSPPPTARPPAPTSFPAAPLPQRKPLPLPLKQTSTASHAKIATSSTAPSTKKTSTAIPTTSVGDTSQSSVSPKAVGAKSNPTPIIPSSKSTPIIPSSRPTLPLSSKHTPVVPSSKPTLTSSAKISHAAPNNVIQSSSSASSSPNLGISGLSTKSRLSQGALLPTAPKPVAKTKLSDLSFKKKPSLATSASSSRPPVPTRPRREPMLTIPQAEPSFLPPALSRKSKANHEEADAFLEKLALDVRSGSVSALDKQDLFVPPPPPFESKITDKQELPPPIVGSRPKIPTSFKKKWSWSGSLLANVGGKVEQFCDAYLHDVTPAPTTGPTIEVAMHGQDSFRLETFHELLDMHQFLRPLPGTMWEKPPQVARLDPKADKDREPLRILASYMASKKFTEVLAGHLLVFTPHARTLCKVFGVPHSPENAEFLKAPILLALIRWTPTADWRRPLGLLSGTAARRVNPEDWKKSLLIRKYHVALRILKFPVDVLEWIARDPRRYTIWSIFQDRVDPQDTETMLLMSVLARHKAKRTKHDFRITFIHVGALKTLRKMPYLVEQRSRSCTIHFYTYGTHPSIPPDQWRVREIYPCALFMKTPGVFVTKIRKIAEHPLWTCYMLPTVLGMATRLCCPDEDPLAAFDSGIFVFERLLKAFDDGAISLLRAPPDRVVTRKTDATTDWLRDHWITRPLNSRQVLEYSLNAFHAKYANLPREAWPVIMESYRRFVVIRAKSDPPMTRDKEGFEWTPPSEFSFNDDYYKNKN